MKILIVDEDTNRNRAIRSILANLGYKSADVESAGESAAAMAVLKKKKFDCVFVSQDQEKIKGLELLQEIRSSQTLKGLPVVMISSEITRESVIAAGQAGANGVVSYPCSVNDIEGALRQAVAKKN